MVTEERWTEIRQLHERDHVSISEIARRLDLDRKTVRRAVRERQWRPYHRGPASATVLTGHVDWLRDRAPAVEYSARVLYQELCHERGFTGSYETVKRFVAPLRTAADQAGLCQRRFKSLTNQRRLLPIMPCSICIYTIGTRFH